MIAKTMLEKERKEIEALLEKELGKKVTLNIQ
jgi:F0F1-type ATP synthase delta subunit